EPRLLLNDLRTPEISPLSLHDALPISRRVFAVTRCAVLVDRACSADLKVRRYGQPWGRAGHRESPRRCPDLIRRRRDLSASPRRSEEHTSELQSRENLVCRLLLEKKKK